MSFFKPDYGLVHDHLSEVDLVAVQNVASGKGGPFSAAIVVLADDDKGAAHVAYTLAATGNAVLTTGRASAHAEDQAMTPSALSEVEAEIIRLRETHRAEDLRILFLSSAQPCMACYSKIEIFTRDFIARGLVLPLHMTLVFGASYAETEEVAGFNDYIYAIDFVRAARRKRAQPLLVPMESVGCEDVQECVRAALYAGSEPAALVMKHGQILSVAGDSRKESGLFSTAECAALHEASRLLRLQGDSTPWDLGGATLYTRTEECGPLIYAEAQWAGIGRIVSVRPPQNGRAYEQTQETSDCTNAELFTTLASGYNNPKSAVTVYRDETYANLGQEAWWTKADRCTYNGLAAGSAFDSGDRADFDRRFAPHPFCPDDSCAFAQQKGKII